MLSTMFWLIPNICNFCKEWQDCSSTSKFSLENNPVSSICKYFNLDFTPFKFKLPSTFMLESFKYLQPFSTTISKNSVGTHFPWRLIFCHNVSSLLMALRSKISMKLTDYLKSLPKILSLYQAGTKVDFLRIYFFKNEYLFSCPYPFLSSKLHSPKYKGPFLYYVRT